MNEKAFPQLRKVKVLEAESGTDVWPAKIKLVDHIARLKALLRSVPAKHREDCYATVDIEYNEHDTPVAKLQIMYRRTETQKEADARVAAIEAESRRRETGERAEYERLRKKFGPQ